MTFSIWLSFSKLVYTSNWFSLHCFELIYVCVLSDWSHVIVFITYNLLSTGCRECQCNNWTSTDWKGMWNIVNLVLRNVEFFALVGLNNCFKLLRQQRLGWIKWLTYYTWNMLFPLLQDPTAQTEIDNFMVQQLDGTVNEWGWCKQKVSCFLNHLLVPLFFLMLQPWYCTDLILDFDVSSVQMLYWQYLLPFVKQVPV